MFWLWEVLLASMVLCQFAMAGGYPCCCTPAHGCPCTETSLPTSITVVVAGMANDSCASGNCTNFNGTYVLPFASNCRYSLCVATALPQVRDLTLGCIDSLGKLVQINLAGSPTNQIQGTLRGTRDGSGACAGTPNCHETFSFDVSTTATYTCCSGTELIGRVLTPSATGRRLKTGCGTSTVFACDNPTTTSSMTVNSVSC